MLLPSRDIKEANVLSSQAKYRRCSIGMWILLFDGDVDRRTSTPRWTSICPPYIYKHLSTRNLLFNLYSQELISACKDKIKYLHPKLLILIHWFWVIWYLSLSLSVPLSLCYRLLCSTLSQSNPPHVPIFHQHWSIHFLWIYSIATCIFLGVVSFPWTPSLAPFSVYLQILWHLFNISHALKRCQN